MATVTGTDRADADDTAPTTVLSDDAIRALVTAALDEADGRITDIDVDGDDVNPYDVSVLGTDNRTIEIELDADMRVVRSEIDD
ncbi:MAG: PepSY domain-containing protein [Actinomycetota bacterium]